LSVLYPWNFSFCESILQMLNILSLLISGILMLSGTKCKQSIAR